MGLVRWLQRLALPDARVVVVVVKLNEALERSLGVRVHVPQAGVSRRPNKRFNPSGGSGGLSSHRFPPPPG